MDVAKSDLGGPAGLCLSQSLCHTPVMSASQDDKCNTSTWVVGKVTPSLQLQQYTTLPADYIRPSDIICLGYVIQDNVLKIPLINVLIGPRQGRAWRVAPACHGGDRIS